METILTLLKDNAPMAVMFLATALYLGGDIQALHTEMAAGDQALRTTMVEEFKAVRSDLSDLRERMARVETRLDSIEDRLYMDTALLPM